MQLLQVAVPHKGVLFLSLDEELSSSLSGGIFLGSSVCLKGVHFLDYLLHGRFLISADLIVKESAGQDKKVYKIIGDCFLATSFYSQTLDHVLLVNETESSFLKIEINDNLVNLGLVRVK
jgi:hypothetical protein